MPPKPALTSASATQGAPPVVTKEPDVEEVEEVLHVSPLQASVAEIVGKPVMDDAHDAVPIVSSATSRLEDVAAAIGQFDANFVEANRAQFSELFGLVAEALPPIERQNLGFEPVFPPSISLAMSMAMSSATTAPAISPISSFNAALHSVVSSMPSGLPASAISPVSMSMAGLPLGALPNFMANMAREHPEQDQMAMFGGFGMGMPMSMGLLSTANAMAQHFHMASQGKGRKTFFQSFFSFFLVSYV